MGGGSVDHFIAKSANAGLAYAWDLPIFSTRSLSGEHGTLIVTRDEANGSIDSAKITKLIADVLN